ncbi:sporulation protein [Nonomuraea sp. WAC 01424]|uniref:sporulation protein n=1 Tax=Nonomuraea sp. WAC 01424 TaxID=2203200 RepID=UPI000F7AE492|nr:sporulation protein [Nonomuraea sp. WAC 01424]RSN14749.1 sporulation protein [Nonomuraea sp. WAC 01424]
MVFKRMLGAFGVGAPSVDTVLATPRVQPGGTLSGEVRLKGGDFDAEIEHVTLGLVARVEFEHGDGEHAGAGEFSRVQVSGPFLLRQGEERTIAFEIGVPWEAPISRIGGQPLHGMALGVRTELAIAKAVDKGDLDEIAVEPLPSQLGILEALLQLGFAFKSADLEAGRLYGVHQQLPFYQEIEFHPPARYAGVVGELEVTFVADPAGLEVVLEADKGAGRYSGDAIGRFTVSHADALHTDWAGELDRWLSGLASHGHGGYGDHHGGYGGHHGDHHGDHHGGHHGYGHHEQHQGGPGWGAVAAAAVVGVVGGLVAGEIVEEIFEGDDDESGDGDW